VPSVALGATSEQDRAHAGGHIDARRPHLWLDQMHRVMHRMKWLVDEAYPDAKVVRVVLDNLNIHTIASLYATFPAPEARRIARKLEFHPTPKHGSWLNVVESELAALSTQCLNRRLPTLPLVRKEVTAWERQRNSERVTIHWLFTTADARRKLRHAYPIPA